MALVFVALVSLGVSSFWIVRLRKEVKKRERIQKELEKASQVKSSFMARMSHEIRTPLNAIIGLSYILKRKQATAAQKVQLDRITQAANTMLGIVNDLLDFSKIEAGKVEIENMPFNIESVIQNVLVSFPIACKRLMWSFSSIKAQSCLIGLLEIRSGLNKYY